MSGFIRNAWYVLAWSHELGRHLLSRRVLGESIVAYRRRDGRPVALRDRCPHKLLPLSLGRLVDDEVQCGYHGARFAEGGRCVHIPGQDRIPQGAHVHGYPLHEKYNAVWIWMGDPALADPAAIIDIPQYGRPGWALIDGNYLHVASNYLNICDNLVDPSHTSYVHPRTIGNAAGEGVPVTLVAEADRVIAYRWIENAPPVPLMQRYGRFQGLTDRWQYYWCVPPAVSGVDFGAIDAGTERTEANRDAGFRSFSYNFITPETERTSHYFWLHLRNYAVSDAEADAEVRRLYALTFEEDRELLAVIQAQQDEAGTHEFVRFALDGASVKVRRMIAQRLSEEAQAAAGGCVGRPA